MRQIQLPVDSCKQSDSFILLEVRFGHFRFLGEVYWKYQRFNSKNVLSFGFLKNQMFSFFVLQTQYEFKVKKLESELSVARNELAAATLGPNHKDLDKDHVRTSLEMDEGKRARSKSPRNSVYLEQELEVSALDLNVLLLLIIVLRFEF